MAIEITPKVKIKLPIWTAVLLGVCLVSVLILLISYFYFITSSKKMEETLLPTSEEKALQKGIETKERELTLYKEKIDTFGELLSEHQNTVEVFNLLEKSCFPNVWFTNFSFIAEKREATLSGLADNFMTLGQQILAFKAEPFIKKVNLTELSLSKGEINFSLLLTFDPQLFK